MSQKYSNVANDDVIAQISLWFRYWLIDNFYIWSRVGLLRISLGILRGITEDFNGRVDVELLLLNIFGFMNFYLFIFCADLWNWQSTAAEIWHVKTLRHYLTTGYLLTPLSQFFLLIYPNFPADLCKLNS